MNQAAELSLRIETALNINCPIISTIRKALPETLAISVFGNCVNATANADSARDVFSFLSNKLALY